MPGSPRRKVLVVDDNADTTAMMAMLLGHLGHEVATAADGHAALAAARRLRPDTIFLDIALPGLDGFCVAEQIRADPAFARTVIVAVTALGSHEERVRAHEAGIDVYLLKPVDTRFIESFVGDARTER